ncbi:MAG: hypothetical protein D6784_10815 [Chloroflexi bacterium]|nr:MAG: hypothetical protein D6784_10815 [Chloroflexota bacterium]
MLFKAAVERYLSANTARRLMERDLWLQTLRPDTSRWLAGYPWSGGTDFPDPGILRQFILPIHSQLEDIPLQQTIADLWLAYLVRLLDKNVSLNTTGLDALLSPSGVEVEKICQTVPQLRVQIIKALDELDLHLQNEQKWIFINYDELDTLGGIDWELMALLVRGLLTFWTEHFRRWHRLQVKIFLRKDLYDNVRIFTADFSKLAATRIELTWAERNLYAMLIKRMANLSHEWLEYCRTAGIDFEKDDHLGWIPQIPRLEAAQPLIQQIAGQFMGSSIKKGRTFTWILGHLRDGHGYITPRALVGLWGYAAAQELDSQRASGMQLLHPTSLRRALDDLSDEYVRMIKDREMPWLEGLTRLLAGKEVPMTRQEWLAILRDNWQSWVNNPSEKQRPPRPSPEQFLDFLLELGVCRRRPDDRIDVPDLFLHGLGIKRRGGVKR